MPKRFELRVPAIEVRQSPSRTLYTFAVDGKDLPLFATVSRVRRDEAKAVAGYQRPEVLSHIASIKSYLESEDPMIPNSLVIAFDSRVRFEPTQRKGRPPKVSRSGELIIPIDPSIADEDKPGWIVDGQQRGAAIREARVSSFPICVNAFITDDERDQRAQFILVNSTKPLPKGLIHELLPGTEAHLPRVLQLRRFPSLLLERLNYDDDSPIRNMIRTPTSPEGVIKDNSVLRMLENSLSDGALYLYRDPRTGEGDADAMLQVVKTFWAAVADIFPTAWGLPPRRSRLMHGVGIIALGFIMDAIAERFELEDFTLEVVRQDLELLKPLCAWNSGSWDFGTGLRRDWNDLQNTPRDIQLLTNYLLHQYTALTWQHRRESTA
jgi:DGQHR domain-containing protein